MASEDITNRMVWGYSEGEARGGLGAGEGEAAAGGTRGIDGIEVEGDMTIEVVEFNATVAVELRDVEIGVRAEQVLEGLVEGVEQGEELRW